VIATELPTWSDRDCPKRYRERELKNGPPEALAEIDHLQVHGPFALARRIKNSRISVVRSSVYDLPRQVRGPFDFIILSNVLTHLRDPDLALEAIAEVLSPAGTLIIAASVVEYPDSPSGALFSGYPASITWLIPTPQCLAQWCRMAGIATIEVQSRFRLETLRGPKSISTMAVLHARKRA
jgi:SAM-dependent methyltransferase